MKHRRAPPRWRNPSWPPMARSRMPWCLLSRRHYQVNLQSEANFRERPEDLKQVFVRSSSGSMIPIDTLLRMERIIGPDQVDRFNAFTAAKVMGNPAPGYSSGQAIKVMQELANQTF